MFPYRDDNPTHSFPFVTVILIGINVAVFFLLALGPDYEQIVQEFGFLPSEHRPITYFSSLFLHGGWGHLLFNMWYLWLFGDNLEERFGPFWFLLFYLAGGVLSMVLHGLMTPPSMDNVPAIGASGAISAVMGGYVTLFPQANVRVLWFLFYSIQTFKISALVFLGIWFFEQLFSGGLGTLAGVSTGIAYWAHIGGFVYGVVVALIVRLADPTGGRRTEY